MCARARVCVRVNNAVNYWDYMASVVDGQMTEWICFIEGMILTLENWWTWRKTATSTILSTQIPNGLVWDLRKTFKMTDRCDCLSHGTALSAVINKLRMPMQQKETKGPVNFTRLYKWDLGICSDMDRYYFGTKLSQKTDVKLHIS